MKKYIDYINYRRSFVVVLLAIFLIFAIVYFSYDIYLEAYFYALFLCLVVTFIFLAYDFRKVSKKIAYIKKIDEQFDERYINSFSKNDVIIKAYNQIVKKMISDIKQKDLTKDKEIRDLEEFFIMWTHQIKLPISALNLYLDSNEDLNKRVLKGQIKRIQKYTDMVMAYIRLESDKSDFLFKSIDLDSMIKNVIKEFKLDFINKKLELSYTLLEKEIITDKKWFQFILEQILSNALKYTKKGGIKIYIVDEELVIEDSGTGINPGDVKRVFDKGYTGYNGREISGASGLGLYLVKKTLSSLHHSIRIESDVKKGTKVFIGLKRYDFIGE